MMIIVTAKMKVKSGFKDKFVGEAQDLIKHTRSEEGCLSYSLYSDTDDPDHLVMLEHWKDMSSLDSHMESDHFKKFGEILDKYLEEDIEIAKFSSEPI